jgi:hypothetical protein
MKASVPWQCKTTGNNIGQSGLKFLRCYYREGATEVKIPVATHLQFV